MAKTTQDLQRTEARPVESAEQTRTRQTYSPRADVYETTDSIVVVADMPGVDEESVDITLERNVLTVRGRTTNGQERQKFRLTYAEFETGDYERSFALPQETDRANIEAMVRDGVLQLRLPKSPAAAARKIPVKAG